MRYIVSGLITVAGEILSDIMGFFTGPFWQQLGISTKGRGLEESIMHPAAGGVFDLWLPGAGEVYSAFVVIGLFIVLLLLIMGLLKAMLPSSLAEAEHPITVIARSIIAAGAVVYSALIICLIQQPMGQLYEAIYEMGTSGTYLAGGFDEEGGSLWSSIVPGSGNSSALENTSQFDLLETLGGGLLSIVLLAAIALNFLKLVLEMVERYVTTCFLFYVSPLAFSAVASKSTQGIAAGFMRMLFAQYLLIIFNCIFLFVFIWSYSNVLTDYGKYSIDSMTTLLMYFAVMLAWLKLGQRLDEHMNTLGLGAARTGAGLLGDIMAAGYTAAEAGKVLTGALGLGANAVKAAGKTDTGSSIMGRFSASPAGKAAGAVSAAGTGLKNMAAGNAPRKTADQAIESAIHTGGAAAESIAAGRLGKVGTAMSAPRIGGGRISDGEFSFRQGADMTERASISTVGSDGRVWSSAVGSYESLKSPVAMAAAGSDNPGIKSALDEMGFKEAEGAPQVAGVHAGSINGKPCAIFDSEIFSRRSLEESGLKAAGVDIGGRKGYLAQTGGMNTSEEGFSEKVEMYARKAFRDGGEN